MNRIFIALFILALATLACGTSTPRSVDDYLKEYGGNREVYEKIFALNDCGQLQEQFDIASANNQAAEAGTAQFKQSLGYMAAADAHMKELDCYSSSSQQISPPTNTVMVPTEPISSPTLYILPTLTKPVASIPESTAIPTSTVIFLLATNAPSGPLPGICSCSSDSLNCSDFSSREDAQACYDQCVASGIGDIHKLDQDNDGEACESL